MFSPFADLDRIHFVGIGGAGMSGIAEILYDYEQAHLQVSGCDLSAGEATEHLRAMGIDVRKGHSPDHLGGFSGRHLSAVSEDNGRAARRARGIPVVRRAEIWRSCACASASRTGTTARHDDLSWDQLRGGLDRPLSWAAAAPPRHGRAPGGPAFMVRGPSSTSASCADAGVADHDDRTRLSTPTD